MNTPLATATAAALLLWVITPACGNEAPKADQEEAHADAPPKTEEIKPLPLEHNEDAFLSEQLASHTVATPTEAHKTVSGGTEETEPHSPPADKPEPSVVDGDAEENSEAGTQQEKAHSQAAPSNEALSTEASQGNKETAHEPAADPSDTVAHSGHGETATTEHPSSSEKAVEGTHSSASNKEGHATTGGHGETGHAAAGGHGETQAGAQSENAQGANLEHDAPPEVMSMQANELKSYAEKAYEDGRYDTAMIAYRQLLAQKMPKAEIRAALLGFGRSLRKKGELTKSVAVYERLIKDFPPAADTPELYLELGRAQRALGAYKTAIARFYNVINSTIKLPEDGAAQYRQLARTAQFEIAETYFIAGNYKEASRFYSRLRLLDLAPVDRARAHFKAAYALQLSGDYIGAITQLRSFAELNPDDEYVPEARYLIASSLRKMGRSQDALYEALELLRTERTKTAQDPKRWAYWQRKTGNQIANEFYEQGDTTSALSIYLSLVELSSEPSWRAPILYQIAMCQERQGRKDKAIENYKTILDIAEAQKGDALRKADYDDLARMAKWRLSQIEWVHSAEERLNTLLPLKDEETKQ